MRKYTVCLFAFALGGTCLAQQWELGAAGGLERKLPGESETRAQGSS